MDLLTPGSVNFPLAQTLHIWFVLNYKPRQVLSKPNHPHFRYFLKVSISMMQLLKFYQLPDCFVNFDNYKLSLPDMSQPQLPASHRYKR